MTRVVRFNADYHRINTDFKAQTSTRKEDSPVGTVIIGWNYYHWLDCYHWQDHIENLSILYLWVNDI